MNGNDAAFPIATPADWDINAQGLTKREDFAKAALQGLLANPNTKGAWETIAEASVWAADALIAALQEPAK